MLKLTAIIASSLVFSKYALIAGQHKHTIYIASTFTLCNKKVKFASYIGRQPVCDEAAEDKANHKHIQYYKTYAVIATCSCSTEQMVTVIQLIPSKLMTIKS